MDFERRRSPRRCAKVSSEEEFRPTKRTSLDFKLDNPNKIQKIDHATVHLDILNEEAEPKERNKIEEKGLLLSSLETFVREMVIYTQRRARTPFKFEKEVDEWVNFFKDLVEEFQKKTKLEIIFGSY